MNIDKEHVKLILENEGLLRAVKYIKEYTGLPLKESKEIFDRIIREDEFEKVEKALKKIHEWFVNNDVPREINDLIKFIKLSIEKLK